MVEKSPAFQFYPQDYLASAKVAEMSLEEEGVYIRLLCYCWTTGSIPADPERCARLAGKGCSIETATAVQRAFNGRSTDVQRLTHDRLEKERQKQLLHRQNASKAGKKSAAKRKSSHEQVDATTINDKDLEPAFNGRSTDVQRKVNSSSSSSDEDECVCDDQSNRSVDQFAQFWNVYPRKVAKGQAVRAWKTAMKKTSAEDLIEAAKKYARQQDGVDRQYIANPATWLNGERWADEDSKPKSGGYLCGLDWNDPSQRAEIEAMVAREIRG